MIHQRASRAAVTDVYEDQLTLIHDISVRFARRYGRDFSETLAEANLHFLEAYHGYEPGRGSSLEQRIQFVVWQRLLDTVRLEKRRSKIMPSVYRGVDHGAPIRRTDDEQDDHSEDPVYLDPEPFDRDGLNNALTDDARMVVDLLLNSPEPLEVALRESPGFRKPSGAMSTLRCLRRYLIDNLKWGRSRVSETFEELREVLSDGD